MKDAETLDDILATLYNAAWVEGSNYNENNPEGSEIPSKREIAKTKAAKAAILKLFEQEKAKIEIEMTSIIWQSIGKDIAWDDGRFGGISKMALNDYIENQRRDAKRLLAERLSTTN